MTAIWKAAGVFGDMEINAAEFTPRDVYQLKIFKGDSGLLDECRRNDKELPFCQLMGDVSFFLW